MASSTLYTEALPNGENEKRFTQEAPKKAEAVF
jgi:hypothetical protein